ncbi:MAG: hypothetical protein LQ351_006670 [Letrouitia transgressa]|nr:MAG: hypothetical protein LQ351_006670 [Letrouitia transgressa]
MGGYIAGSNSLVDMIRSLSRGFIFTTAPPPATMAGAQAAIEFQRHNAQDRMQLQRNVRTVKKKLRERALPVLPNQSHIVPLMVGDAEKCKIAADILFDEYGIYVQPINSPSVNVGQERLRISPTAAHTAAHQQKLVDALDHIWTQLGLKRINEWRMGKDGSASEGWNEPAATAPVWTDAQLNIMPPALHQQEVPFQLGSRHMTPLNPRHLEDTRMGW